jgi:hypothetical protein
VRRIRCAARVVLRCFPPSPRDALRLFRTCHGRADLSVRYVVRCLHGSRDGRALLLLAVRWVRPWVGTHTHSARRRHGEELVDRDQRAMLYWSLLDPAVHARLRPANRRWPEMTFSGRPGSVLSIDRCERSMARSLSRGCSTMAELVVLSCGTSGYFPAACPYPSGFVYGGDLRLMCMRASSGGARRTCRRWPPRCGGCDGYATTVGSAAIELWDGVRGRAARFRGG